MSDTSLQRTEALILVVLAVGFVLTFVIRRLRRARPGFVIAGPVAVGVVLRVLAAVAVNFSGVQSQLRGFDENKFLGYAHQIASQPWGRDSLPQGLYQLQTDVFAAQLKLLPLSNTGLRITQIGIAMLGIVLILAAVYDLAGARAARLAAWLMALEPSNLFFNSALHKEPLMVLASGLVVFGGTKLWQRLNPAGLAYAALGGLIAIETRSYAGWFLVSASVLLLLFAGLRHLSRPLRAMPVVYAVALVVFLVTPTLLNVTSKKSLQTLQGSQNANTNPGPSGQGAPNGNNLALEQINFSSRGAIVTNLPKRMADITFKPFPWQTQNVSQQLGALGTMVWIIGLLFLLRYAWASRGRILELSAPILCPFAFLLIAYSLAAGNAGTGFRYRSHLVLLAAAMLGVLRAQLETARETTPPQPSVPRVSPTPADRAAIPA